MTTFDEKVVEALKEIMRDVFNSGWTQGSKEHTSYTGGKKWEETTTYKNIETTIGKALAAIQSSTDVAGDVEFARVVRPMLPFIISKLDYDDSGPRDEGWQSIRLAQCIETLRSLVPQVKR